MADRRLRQVGDPVAVGIAINPVESEHGQVRVEDHQPRLELSLAQGFGDHQRPLVGGRRATIGRGRDGQYQRAAIETCELLPQCRQPRRIDMAAGEFFAGQPGQFDVVAEPRAMVFADSGCDHQPVVGQGAGACRNLPFFPVDRSNLGLQEAIAQATCDVGVGDAYWRLGQQAAKPAVGQRKGGEVTVTRQ